MKKNICPHLFFALIAPFFWPASYLCPLNIDSIKKTEHPLNVAVLGTGYVGLVSGAGLATLGHHVTCTDIDQEKITKLNQCIMPIFEPELRELVEKNFSEKRLLFSPDLDKTITEADIIIIAVGTPMNDHGDADLSALMSVAQSIKKNINGYKIICTKSTVPIGTNRKLKLLLSEDRSGVGAFDIVSNPEFLREGSALQDFFCSNPIVIGSDSEKALLVMENLYKPLIDNETKLIKTNTFSSAETIKYAWNAYSTIKISYINQLAHLCNAVDANIATVIEGMSFSEKLLPLHCVKPGPGIGGSCLPKDTAALVSMSKELGVDMSIVSEARRANEMHKKTILNDFFTLFGSPVKDKKIAILGLSFKANTDDIRYSPAIDIAKELLNRGARVYAYDPQAMNNMSKIAPTIHYCSSTEEALTNAEAFFLLTDWNEFKQIDLDHVAKIMARRVVMDMRNVFDPEKLTKLNFTFKNLGYQYA